MEREVLIINRKDEDKFLRRKTHEFQFSKKAVSIDGENFAFHEIDELIRRMRKIMKTALGVGLSANQIGLPYRLFVAEVPDANGTSKFYAVFNPKLERDREVAVMEEGCLSVPGKYGFVERSTKVKLTGFDKRGKVLKIKAWGFLAHVFQHEVDHLDGKLFIDKAREIYDVPKTERLAGKSNLK